MIVEEAALARLMAQAQRGDRAAYSGLLSECANWLEAYFRRKAPPAQVADLVQEVLLAIHAKRATYDPARPFMPWLAAIARYRWVDALRRTYRQRETELLEDRVADLVEEEALLARISLERMLAQLPPRHAEAIELTKIEGYSVTEAAARTGQSESAIKVNVHRGLKRLAALIEKAE